MNEEEKERQRREMQILDELADQYNGHYVVQTPPGKPKDHDQIRDFIKKRKRELNHTNSY